MLNQKKKLLYVDANISYGWAMSKYLPYQEIKFERSVKLDDNLNTSDKSDIGYFIESDLNYPDNIKQKKTIHLLPKIKNLILMKLVII